MGEEKTLLSLKKNRSFGTSRRMYLENLKGQKAVIHGVGTCVLLVIHY
jgi:hypothetical protein